MTTVTLTRHYSGFQNVADKYSVGSNEHAGRASVSDWILPDGYEVDDDVIRDAAGYECAIIPDDDSGRPQLVSKAGPIDATPVLQRAPAQENVQ